MSEAQRTPFVESLADAATQAHLPGAGIGWLDAARRENLEALLSAGLPDTRVEAWKYTALRALGQRRFAQGDTQALTREVDGAAFALPGVDGPALVFVNGVFRADLSRIDALPAGLQLQPLSQALQGDAEPLRFALSRHYREGGDAFARLNAAFAGDGVVLRVAAGAKVAQPVHLVFVGAAAESDLAWHVRHVIELGEGAELSVAEHHVASGEQQHLGTQVTDIVLRKGAQLRHVTLQNAASGGTLIRHDSVQLDEDAQATLYVLELGGGLVRHDLHATLAGDRSRLETRGVFVLNGRQHVDTQMAIRHQALNTASDSVWRGVADQRSRGVFRGAIVVAEGADGSDASLSSKNLLLSGQAEIDTKPELEIYADEVKAAHGATVGQLDERSLFYLCSRGIPLAEARAMLTAAFCRAVFASLDEDALREHLDQQLMAHLPSA
ncbi:Fe-S cluster assembly protein SufD [Dyella jiangningensis]|uniref:Fe-S cluster assembly protein SufD n=1 Tax=Dyella jiangningensis TaxID=1379159 RepID=A0A328P2H5_9GAMM|nr:Fe-S cluster assembly protein SufD [Dyella jiangningensis]RAO75481.1 Fe-S cluster assembly protein SufD [Dyella jiangningensis]